MRKFFIRLISVVLAALCFGTAAGCGENSTPKTSGKVEEVSFPLSEPAAFTFMISGTKSATFDKDLSENKLWKELEEKTNVHVDFQFLGDNESEKLSLLMSSGEYGDVLWGGPILNSVEASKYIAAGKLQDITDYIIPDLMPELCADIEENPNIKNMITASDGRIYTLPKITGLEGNYLESPIWVNKKWLDNLGIGVPTTLNDFTAMLKAFGEKDPNGNGLPDEIPYICSTSSTSMHLEALLGIWGITTKDGVNDAFVQVRDGKVEFVPVSDAYKEAVEYLSMLYKDGLMWSECFTSNASTLNAKLISETPVVGCFTAPTPVQTSYKDDYICIYPPKAEGYDPVWYYHPGINGSKNQFFVTDKCRNTSVLMAWTDMFYDLGVAIASEYGSVGDGRLEQGADGKYTFVELDMATTAKLNKESPTLEGLLGNEVRSITTKDFSEKINLGEEYQILQDNYAVYKDIIAKEIWPRPYYSAEDSYEADTYVTDINYQVSLYRASWITGKTDVNKEWKTFTDKINSLGLKEYLGILQRAYDAYGSTSH